MLQRVIRKFPSDHTFVIDTNPSFGLATRMALISAKELIIPTTIDEFAVGGFEHILQQMGCNPDNAQNQPMSFKKWIEAKQRTEKDGLNTFGGLIVRYKTLTFPKIRGIVINRVKSSGNPIAAETIVLRMIMDAVATAYRSNRHVFANPYAPPGVHVPDVEAIADISARQKEAREIISRYYTTEIIELQGSRLISQHLGLAVSMLVRPKYRIQYPDYGGFNQKGQEHGGNNEITDASLGTDSVKFGLQIQNLVEQTHGSSAHPAFVVKGMIHQQNGDFDIISPRPNVVIPANADPCELNPAYRGGRRVMTIETFKVSKRIVHWEPIKASDTKKKPIKKKLVKKRRRTARNRSARVQRTVGPTRGNSPRVNRNINLVMT